MNCDTKIRFLVDSKGSKLLPFQFYNLFGLISLPMIGKRPFIKGWNLFTHTVHPSDITQNIGILAGKINNITVLDLDGEEAIKYFKELSKKHKEIKAPTVKTPGGIHIYFKYTPKLKSTLRLKGSNSDPSNNSKLKWDIKNNGIIAAPPSVIGKNKYKWVRGKSLNDINPPEMPNWLIEFIQSRV